jgi:hypothetical protein
MPFLVHGIGELLAEVSGDPASVNNALAHLTGVFTAAAYAAANDDRARQVTRAGRPGPDAAELTARAAAMTRINTSARRNERDCPFCTFLCMTIAALDVICISGAIAFRANL